MSVTDLYSYCVGRGMSPEYFKKELRPYEAEAYLKGVEQAQRTSWEQTRLQMYSFLKPWSPDIKKDTDVLEFPWDKERAEAEAPTREEIDSVREWAACATEMLNKKTNGRKRDSSEITTRL